MAQELLPIDVLIQFLQQNYQAFISAGHPQALGPEMMNIAIPSVAAYRDELPANLVLAFEDYAITNGFMQPPAGPGTSPMGPTGIGDAFLGPEVTGGQDNTPNPYGALAGADDGRPDFENGAGPVQPPPTTPPPVPPVPNPLPPTPGPIPPGIGEALTGPPPMELQQAPQGWNASTQPAPPQQTPQEPSFFKGVIEALSEHLAAQGINMTGEQLMRRLAEDPTLADQLDAAGVAPPNVLLPDLNGPQVAQLPGMVPGGAGTTGIPLEPDPWSHVPPPAYIHPGQPGSPFQVPNEDYTPPTPVNPAYDSGIGAALAAGSAEQAAGPVPKVPPSSKGTQVPAETPLAAAPGIIGDTPAWADVLAGVEIPEVYTPPTPPPVSPPSPARLPTDNLTQAAMARLGGNRSALLLSQLLGR